jgi:hypothetical protein
MNNYASFMRSPLASVLSVGSLTGVGKGPECFQVILWGGPYEPGNCGVGSQQDQYSTRIVSCSLGPGWVVQQVVRTFDIELCNGDKAEIINEELNRKYGGQYYEGWKVERGKVYDTNKDGFIITGSPATDIFAHRVPEFENLKGTITIEGHFMYIPGSIDWSNDVDWVSDLDQPNQRSAPPGFQRSGSTLHKLTLSWNCCQKCPTKKTSMVGVPAPTKFVWWP